MGAVAPTAILVAAAGEALVGTTVDENAIAAAIDAVRAACRPIDDKRGTAEYRIKVSGVIFKRATAIALQRAQT
jgi:carbon-monoxide dehydrogenase medium subunit